jgi:hypothetical protein
MPTARSTDPQHHGPHTRHRLRAAAAGLGKTAGAATRVTQAAGALALIWWGTSQIHRAAAPIAVGALLWIDSSAYAYRRSRP